MRAVTVPVRLLLAGRSVIHALPLQRPDLVTARILTAGLCG